MLGRGAKDKEHAISQTLNTTIAVVGIDIGKNSFHIVGLDERGAIVVRQKWSRGQVEARFTNMSPCLVGMEACVGAHHLSRKLNKVYRNVRCRIGEQIFEAADGRGRERWLKICTDCKALIAMKRE
jgi:transposase